MSRFIVFGRKGGDWASFYGLFVGIQFGKIIEDRVFYIPGNNNGWKGNSFSFQTTSESTDAPLEHYKQYIQ